MKLKRFLNREDTFKKQAQFIRTIEAMGDILVFETKRKAKTETIEKGLSYFLNYIDKFLEIQINEPDRFDKLILTEEFAKIQNKDKEDIQLRLSFDSQKYLKSFTTVVNQIIKIHKTAVDENNDEIGNKAVYSIIGVLERLSSIQDNFLFVEQILRNMYYISYESLESKHQSMYTASYRWYLHIVFNEGDSTDRAFKLQYLNLFDQYLIMSIKDIINHGIDSLFKSLIEYLTSGSHSYSHYENSLEVLEILISNKGGNIYNKYNETILRVRQRMQSIDSLEDLLSLQDQLSQLRNNISNEFLEEEKKKLDLNFRNLNGYIEHRYKIKKLRKIIYIMGAFCWYKKRSDYIKLLWEYKQPPDSDAKWLGPDILPDTIGQLIEYYYSTSFEDKLRHFRDDRHGIRIYFDEFFILFLIKYAVWSYSANNNVKSQLDTYILKDFNSCILYDIINSIPKLIDVSNGLIKKKNVIIALGFKEDDIERSLANIIPDFLNKIKKQAEEQLGDKEKITKISKKRIEEFKEEFLQGYNSEENVLFTRILEYFKLYDDMSHKAEYPLGLIRKGLNNVIDKAIFFEEWYIDYQGYGDQFGRNRAIGKDYEIFLAIFEKCKSSNNVEIDNVLSGISELKETFIILVNYSDYRFGQKNAKFIPEWDKKIQNKIDIPGFEGCYPFESNNVPVFGLHFDGFGKNIVILDAARLGKLIQYNPSQDGDDEDTKTDKFYFNVKAYSENLDMMNLFIKKPPAWLSDIGDESKQRDYLEKKALLHVFERYEFIIATDFEGYKIKISEESDLL